MQSFSIAHRSYAGIHRANELVYSDTIGAVPLVQDSNILYWSNISLSGPDNEVDDRERYHARPHHN